MIVRYDGLERSVESVATVDRALFPFALLGKQELLDHIPSSRITLKSHEAVLLKDDEHYFLLYRQDGLRIHRIIQPSLPTRETLKKLIVSGLSARGVSKSHAEFKEYYQHALAALTFSMRHCPSDSRFTRRATDVSHEMLDLLLRYR